MAVDRGIASLKQSGAGRGQARGYPVRRLDSLPRLPAGRDRRLLADGDPAAARPAPWYESALSSPPPRQGEPADDGYPGSGQVVDGSDRHGVPSRGRQARGRRNHGVSLQPGDREVMTWHNARSERVRHQGLEPRTRGLTEPGDQLSHPGSIDDASSTPGTTDAERGGCPCTPRRAPAGQQASGSCSPTVPTLTSATPGTTPHHWRNAERENSPGHREVEAILRPLTRRGTPRGSGLIHLSRQPGLAGNRTTLNKIVQIKSGTGPAPGWRLPPGRPGAGGRRASRAGVSRCLGR